MDKEEALYRMSKGRTKAGKRARQKTLNKGKKKTPTKGSVVKKRSKKINTKGATAMDTDDVTEITVAGLKLRKPALKLARTTAQPKKSKASKKSRKSNSGDKASKAAAMQE